MVTNYDYKIVRVVTITDHLVFYQVRGIEEHAENSRRINMTHDRSELLALNEKEQLAAQQDLPLTGPSTVSVESAEVDDAQRYATLAELCRQEIQASSHRGEPSNEAYGLELVRHAIVQGNPEVGVGIQQCLNEIVRSWLRAYPGKETACRWESEEYYVALTFERFRQGMIQQHMPFTKLAEALVYLRACLNGAIQETLRTSALLKDIATFVPGELSLEDPQELWKHLQMILPNDREQRLAYLLYHCGLEPGEIVRRCSQEWNDVQEISRLRRTILERLLSYAN